MSFTDPKKLVKYLETSEEAGYMWTDSEDLAVISDMYQVKIKIITTRGEADKNPTVNNIMPNEEMKEFSELKNVELGEMVLFHENNSHFNLIVSENSELAKLGSLSFRANIGPLTLFSTEDEKEMDENTKEDSVDKDLKEIKAELSKVKERNKYIENEFMKCKEELKNKTEENEKLKIEIKDLKEACHLSQNNQLNDVHMKTLSYSSGRSKSEFRTHKRSKHSSEDSIRCKFCSKAFESIEQLSLHIKTEHSNKFNNQEKEFNCNDCCFQAKEEKHYLLVHTDERNLNCNRCEFVGITSSELSRHIEQLHMLQELKCNICQIKVSSLGDLRNHTLKDHDTHNSFRCQICGETFETKGTLMEHRKKEHRKTVAYCQNNLKGNCLFSDSKCWWIHDDQVDTDKKEDAFKCFICDESFRQKGLMMIHKKSKHIESTRYCNLYLDEKCRFKDETCWYKHEDKPKNVSEEKVVNVATENTVFQKVLEDLEPPITVQ